MTNEYNRLAKLINDADEVLTENIFGPGDKRKSGGVARGGKISQKSDSRSRTTGTDVAGAGATPIEPQAKSGEPNPDEDELEKDYLEMDDEPLQPQSPLGKLIAKEFDQEPNGDEEGDEESGEVEEEAISMQGKRKIGGPYQTKNQRYTGTLFTFAQKGGSISWQGKGQGGPEARGLLVVKDNKTGQSVDKRFPSVERAAKAWRNLAKTNLREDYQGNDQTVTNKDGTPLDVDEDAFKTAQKTEPTEVQQMDEPFTVQTKEGPADGKAGDYLAKGVDGEEWPIDQDIFNRTHEFVNEDLSSAYSAWRKAAERGYGSKTTPTDIKKVDDRIRRLKVKYEDELMKAKKAGTVAKGFQRNEAHRAGCGEIVQVRPDLWASMNIIGEMRHFTSRKMAIMFANTKRNDVTSLTAGSGIRTTSFTQIQEGSVLHALTDSEAHDIITAAGKMSTFQLRKAYDHARVKGERDKRAKDVAWLLHRVYHERKHGQGIQKEAIGGKWASSTNHFKPEGDHEAKTMTRGMIKVQVEDGGKQSFDDTSPNLSPEEMKVIDSNWKTILKVSATLFKKHPHPVALRAIEKYLEKLGVDESHSMKIGEIIAKQFNRDTDPTTMIIPKVIPKIQQEPYMRGSGYTSGGSGGLGPAR